LSDQAFARIGQTEDQVNALFGKPVDPGKPDSNGLTTNMYKKQWHGAKRFRRRPTLIIHAKH